jgi:hypothetical protein
MVTVSNLSISGIADHKDTDFQGVRMQHFVISYTSETQLHTSS